MNRLSRWLLLTVALGSLITAYSVESQGKTTFEKYPAAEAEKAQNRAMPAESAPQQPDIGRRADDLPESLNRTQSQPVSVDLYTEERVAEMMPGVTYEYWTFNGKVPGPFIRVRAGDSVELRLRQGKHGVAAGGHGEHVSSGHFSHSIDLHAVVGPGGGMPLTQGGPGEEKSFRFKAMRPGIYVYHCGSPHVPTHVANGMYCLILVEPEQGLAKVDREFYIMQGEFYTSTQSFLFCLVKVNPFVLSPSTTLRRGLVEWDERIYTELNDFYSTYQY